MAAGDVTYGTRTVLANVSRLDSNTNGVAEAFGEIDNSTTAALDYHVRLAVPISSSATTGTYDLYLVESQDGAEWTDNIDPATSGDVVSKISDAKLIASVSTIYNGTHRTEAEFHFNIAPIVGGIVPKFFGFVLNNKSGQTIPSSGSDGDSVSLKIATS